MRTHHARKQKPTLQLWVKNADMPQPVVVSGPRISASARQSTTYGRAYFFLFALLFLFWSPGQLHAQYNVPQNDVWAFSYNEGVKFLPGPAPAPFTTSISTYEGSATICDGVGGLLFYTEGSNIYDKNGILMPNGGAIVPYITNSTTQAAEIVPVIGNPNQYYVFSLESWSGVAGNCLLSYCIVDMTLNGGNGDVIPATRNTALGNGFSEKMTAVAGNNCNIWLLLHQRDAPKFVAYNITAAGISPAVISAATGEIPTGLNAYKIGSIKVSPNRLRVANCVMNGGYGGTGDRLELLDFNPATGIVTGCRVLNSFLNQYDAEFSPDNTKLYSRILGAQIYQYNVSLATTPAIIASQFVVTTSPDWGGQMKLGPDGKIYCQTNVGFLDCINNPNIGGAGCGYAAHSLFIGSSGIGMPNMEIIGSAIYGKASVCVGSTTTLSDAFPGGTWTSMNTSVATVGSGSGVVTGVSVGTAVISYTLTTGCSASIIVTVNPVPSITTGPVCLGGTVTFGATPAGGKWSSSTTVVATIDSTTGKITSFTVGTTTITYKIPGTGCYATAVATVSPLPVITGAPVCVGSSVLFGATPAGGTWSSGNTAVATVDAFGSVTGITAGTASITYTSLAGCVSVITATVYPAPSPIIGSIQMCAGATAMLSDATPGGTWSSSNTNVATVTPGTGLVTGVNGGTAVITYQLTGTSCYATNVVTIDPTPTFTGITSICLGASTLLTPSIPGGTWTSLNTTVATVDMFGNVTSVALGSAGIEYVSPAGCIGTTTVTVNPVPSPTYIQWTTVLCAGTTAYEYVDPGTTGSYTVSWTSSNTSVATVTGTSSTGTVTGVSAGTAIITYAVTTSFGCTGYAYLTVTVLTAPTIGGPTSICMGTPVTISTSVGGGVWTSLNTTVATVDMSGTVTGVSPGTAIIDYSLSNGCSAFITVTVNPTPSPTYIQWTTVLCAGTTAYEYVNPGTTGSYTVSWTSSNTSVATVTGTSSTGTVTGVSAGTAVITYAVTNSFGCTGYSMLTVTVLTAPTIGGPTSICMGTPVTISTSVGGGVWTSLNTTVATVDMSGTVTGVSPGTAIIDYSLSNGCSAFITVTVSPTPKPTYIQWTTVLCAGTTAYEYVNPGTTGSYTVSWTSSNTSVATVTGTSSTGTVTGISAGTAVITYAVTNSFGCTGYALLTVTVLTAPTIGGPTTICMGTPVTISTSVGGGVWTSLNTTVATVDMSGTVTGVSPGTAIIDYSLSNGCSAFITVTVNPTPRPTFIQWTTQVCDGTIAYEYTDPGTTGSYTVSWTSSNTAVATVTGTPFTGTVTTVAPGTSVITFAVTNSFGCTGYAMITVTVLPAPTISGGPLVICAGTIAPLTPSIAGGTWLSLNPPVATVDVSGNVTGVSAGTAIIDYSLSNGCSALEVVTVNPTPKTKFIQWTTQLCTGGTAFEYVDPGYTGPFSFTWSSSNTSVATVSGTSSTGTVVGVSPGTAIITFAVTNSFGCTGVATITVTVYPMPAPITGGPIICIGSGTPLHNTVSGGVWSSDNTSIATVDPFGIVTGVAAGTATISYTTGSSCTVTKIVTVIDACLNIVNPNIVNVTGTPGASVTLQGYDASGAITFTLPGVSIGTNITPYFSFGIGTVKICVISVTFSGTTCPVHCCVHTDGGGMYYGRQAQPNAANNVEAEEGKVFIIPNPNRGTFTVKGSLTSIAAAKDVTIEVVDMLGRIILSDIAPVDNGTINRSITLGNNVANGIYLLRIRTNEENQVLRFSLDR